ncbi:CBF-domain-containing protein [Aureobasidium subglaciale]|nr:CBF-domain-containing protein [Aureobasidium subglaciale]
MGVTRKRSASEANGGNSRPERPYPKKEYPKKDFPKKEYPKNDYPKKDFPKKEGGDYKAKKTPLIFEVRPDWYAATLTDLPVSTSAQPPSQRLVEEIHDYANSLLEAENTNYAANNNSASSSHKFLSTIMASGTLEDKISALTLLVQESPLHNTKAFETLLGLAKKKSRNQALMAVAAVKDLLGQGDVLPGNRKLRAFVKQPALAKIVEEHHTVWRVGSPLPNGLDKTHLIYWAFEDWLKKQYFELLKILESWCGDEVEYARSRAITYVWELLRDKPEQEENLLRLLVNKLGDKDKKIASRTSYLLLQLENTHPAMKGIIVNAIETESLFRPGQAAHAKYYSIITLNQTILSVKEPEVANKLLDIYFGLFIQFLKPRSHAKAKAQKVQGGGGKGGKMAAKKAKALEQADTADSELNEKMVTAVLTGVNRAFPFAKTDDPTFEAHLDTIFRVTHSSNFNTSIQALMLIQQISATKHFSADRFYRTLYESLLDPRLITSSKQIMYLNLLYKSLKMDINVKRVQAFVKRLLQTITLHEAPFVCGVLYLVSELETAFPTIRNMIREPEADPEDEEEHFVDAPEDEETSSMHPSRVDQTREQTAPAVRYDARKRNPEHSNADRSALWEILPLLSHFHPSVAIFAEALVNQTALPPKPDPTKHTLMHFLDRFVYRNAKTKGSTTTRGASIMQPMSGSNAADVLIKDRADPTHRIPLNSDAFWKKKVEDIAADEVFFHDYFTKVNKAKPTKKDKKKQKNAEDSDAGSDADEDEIWNALVESRPEIEGDDDDDDDDLDMDDLEEGYSDSEDGDAGVEIGEFAEDDMDEADLGDDMDEDVEDDGFEGLESADEDAMLGDDADLPSDFEGLDDDVAEKSEKKDEADSKKKKKRKLKHLPTFASADDYAKLLGGDDEDM